MKKAIIVVFIFLSLLKPSVNHAQPIYLGDHWKFSTGDDFRWAEADFNDKDWKYLGTGKSWDEQGYAEFDGHAWYRTKVFLPSFLKKSSLLKDSMKICLGMIDDADQVYINGKLIGQNAGLKSAKFEDIMPWNVPRVYAVACNDPALHWDGENIIAVRVYDQGGPGGMYSGIQYIAMKDVDDYVKIDPNKAIISIKKNKKINCTVDITNLSPVNGFSGTITAMSSVNGITDLKTGKKSKEIFIKKASGYSYSFTFPFSENLGIAISFKEHKSGKTITANIDIPYILTPKPAKTPRINGAKVFGVRPGSPFLFKVAATGDKPLSYAAEGLPAGLTLNPANGIITGKLNEKGEYKVKLTVANKEGKAERELRIVCGETLALTPPMGWNSWNCWGLSVSDAKVRQSADAMVKSGLIDHGWTYINIDDGWEDNHTNGKIVTNKKFPDMKGMCDYVHNYGLKVGIYSSPGPKTCGGYEGSYTFEEQDANSYAEWGIDYLKYDWCSYGKIAPLAVTKDALQKPYLVMRDALLKCNRDIVYSLCQYGMGKVWEWGHEVNGNLWRTTGDINDSWSSLSGIGFSQDKCSAYCKPGRWNDPDMLVVGKVGWGPSLHNTKLNFNEQYTHISLWALLSAPLLIGCDLSQLDNFTLNLLTNDEVIDIDQDLLGKGAAKVVANKTYQVWVKELEDGNYAVGIFNMRDIPVNVTIYWKDIKLAGSYDVRDVWRQKNLGSFPDKFETNIAGHGVTLIKLTGLQ